MVGDLEFLTYRRQGEKWQGDSLPCVLLTMSEFCESTHKIG